jgi:hypothetical protein
MTSRIIFSSGIGQPTPSIFCQITMSVTIYDPIRARIEAEVETETEVEVENEL